MHLVGARLVGARVQVAHRGVEVRRAMVGNGRPGRVCDVARFVRLRRGVVVAGHGADDVVAGRHGAIFARYNLGVLPPPYLLLTSSSPAYPYPY
eukprot:384301-Prymnesium_polylepis.1